MLQSSSRVSNAVATMLNVGPCSERCQNGEKQAGVTSIQDPGLGGRASVECRLTKALRNNDCDTKAPNISNLTFLKDPPPRRPPHTPYLLKLHLLQPKWGEHRRLTPSPPSIAKLSSAAAVACQAPICSKPTSLPGRALPWYAALSLAHS